MHKKFFALLLAVLVILGGLVACRKETPRETTPTISEVTLVPGLNTTPDSFVGFGDPTDGTEPATQPTQETTQPTQETTQPATDETTQPTVSQPTSPPPTTAPAEPTDPSNIDPQQVADAREYVAYMSMDAYAQYEKFKTFSSIEEFNAWFLRIEEAYKALCTNPDYDGGDLVLPE